MDRREFLKYSAGVGGLLLPSSLQANGPANRVSRKSDGDPPQLRVVMTEADGSPLESKRASTLRARNLANDPLPQKIARAPGRVRISLPNEPIQVSLQLYVPGFGEVNCWADNGGKGYSAPGNIEFVVDACATRLQRVREAAALAKQEGVEVDRKTLAYLERATQPANDVRSAYAGLAAGLHAGERVAMLRAKARIARLAKPRLDFLFGCLIAPYARLGPEFERLVRQAFNFATASWYTWGPEEPVEQRINYDRMEGSIQWCLERGIKPKGFGYCYMSKGATPEWLRTWPFERILPEYCRVVEQTMRRYADRIEYAEIINEAHDKANLWDLTQPQIVEMTKATCHAARRGSPNLKRVINHCCQWAEYANKTNPDGSRRWSPYRYLKDCVAGGVEFDVVGLQLYYPRVDLLEIERMLDRYTVFNRPIHITEISTASASEPDLNSMRPKQDMAGWHGEWSEATQADWLEAIYTLVYSKPQFEAITWWDMADIGGHFWPHGGLLRGDLKPKPAYERLLKLQRAWGVGPAAIASANK